ncbi:MAG TPA: hypothetical protein VE964_15245, partial [Myxococcales bacterium]|nr:hypothetical protein [Myxococcales bacterium]
FPAEVVRPFSFGLRSVASDLMFLQAIQVHGGRTSRMMLTAEEGARGDRAMNRLLIYATDLDPQFAGAYRFAGNAMPRQTRDGKVTNALQAEALLAKGVRERADDWHIPFTLGFLQSYFLGHFEEAGKNFAAAARLPGTPPYVGLLATRTLTEGGDLDMAEQLALAMAEQATEESTQREWADRLLDLRMERDLRQIETAAVRYSSRTGQHATSVAALVRAGDLRGMPREPHGGEYLIDEHGEARSSAKARLRIRGRRGTLAQVEVQP